MCLQSTWYRSQPLHHCLLGAPRSEFLQLAAPLVVPHAQRYQHLGFRLQEQKKKSSPGSSWTSNCAACGPSPSNWKPIMIGYFCPSMTIVITLLLPTMSWNFASSSTIAPRGSDSSSMYHKQSSPFTSVVRSCGPSSAGNASGRSWYESLRCLPMI